MTREHPLESLLARLDPRLVAYRRAVRDAEADPPSKRRGRLDRAALENMEAAAPWVFPVQDAINDLRKPGASKEQKNMSLLYLLAAGLMPVGPVARGMKELAIRAPGRATKAAAATAALPVAVGATAAMADAPPPERKPGNAAPSARADEGRDPVQQRLLDEVRSAEETVATLRQAVKSEAKTGFGEKSARATEALAKAEERLNKAVGELRSYRSPEDLEALKDARMDALKTGAAVGVGTGATAGLAALLLRRGRVQKFEKLAGIIGKMSQETDGARIVNTRQGDDLTALVNEAYRTAEARMPFARKADGAPLARRGARDDDLFGPRSGGMVGDTLLPGVATAEGVGALAYGSGAIPGVPPPGPESAQFWQTMGLSSVAAATGFKGARMLGKTALPKGDPAARAIVNAAKTRLQRESAPVARGSAAREIGDLAASRQLQQARIDATQPLRPNPAQALPPMPAVEPPRARRQPAVTAQTAPAIDNRRRRPKDIDLEEAIAEIQRAIEP